MKHIFEYSSYNISAIEKLKNIVESSLQIEGGGEKFFDRIDNMIKDEKNEDIIFELFKKIREKNGNDFNMILSGSFGEKIISMITNGKLKFNGKYTLFNGSITSHQNKMGIISKNKEVNVRQSSIFSWWDNIKDYKLIFVDDSYYSGTTLKLIKIFLSKYEANIDSIYVIYDGNDKPSSNRYSLYSYYDNHSGREWDKNTLIDMLSKIENNNEVKNLIESGKIKTNRELISALNFYWNKNGISKKIDPRNFNFAHQI
jgi:hypoxanthine phosphoribosyltransferase